MSDGFSLAVYLDALVDALVTLAEGLQLALAAHHGDDVANFAGCPICSEWQPKILAAFDHVDAALAALAAAAGDSA